MLWALLCPVRCPVWLAAFLSAGAEGFFMWSVRPGIAMSPRASAISGGADIADWSHLHGLKGTS